MKEASAKKQPMRDYHRCGNYQGLLPEMNPQGAPKTKARRTSQGADLLPGAGREWPTRQNGSRYRPRGQHCHPLRAGHRISWSRPFPLLRGFYIPSGSMGRPCGERPRVRGNVANSCCNPKRGDVIVFRTLGVGFPPPKKSSQLGTACPSWAFCRIPHRTTLSEACIGPRGDVVEATSSGVEGQWCRITRIRTCTPVKRRTA